MQLRSRKLVQFRSIRHKQARSSHFCCIRACSTSHSRVIRSRKQVQLRSIRHRQVLRSHKQVQLRNKKVRRSNRCHNCCYYSNRRYRAYDPKGQTHSFGYRNCS